MRVFVYGTLCDSDVASSVLDDFSNEGGATLHGLQRVEGEYPTLAPDGEVAGEILNTADVGALDQYEGVDRGLYVRVTVPSTDGNTVETYVGDPDALDAPAEWPGTGSFAERVAAYVEANDVRVVPKSDDADRSLGRRGEDTENRDD